MNHTNSLTLLFILITQIVFSFFLYANNKLFLEGVNNADNMQKIFRLHPQIKVLTIKNSTLTEFPANCYQFKELEKVVYIENKYTKSLDNLKECSNIVDLTIIGCNIAPLCFDYLPNLKFLNMKNNNLRKFPYALLASKEIEVLDLSENFIKAIPKGIEKLSKLHTLLLSNNSINNIHYLADLPDLIKLDLRLNNLTIIPVEIGLLTKLTYLNLSENKIKAWHSSKIQVITFLNSLKQEQCNNPFINTVKGWENGLFNLHNLEYLKITDNYMKEIPLALKIFKKLQGISLKRNYIISLPIGLKMDSLKFLDLHGNNTQYGLQQFILLNPHTYVNLI